MAVSTKQARDFDGYFVMNEDFGSDHFNLGAYRTINIQAVVTTSDADGYLQLQTSNDATNWQTVPFVDENGVQQNDGYHVQSASFSFEFDPYYINSRWGRLYYDRTSGTGGCNFYTNRKK